MIMLMFRKSVFKDYPWSLLSWKIVEVSYEGSVWIEASSRIIYKFKLQILVLANIAD